jgi:hypothetical protein
MLYQINQVFKLNLLSLWGATMVHLKLGDRLLVPHGKATVIGFERFNSKGFSAPMSPVQSEAMDERIVCTLDDGHTWPIGKDISENYCAFPHDIMLLNDVEFEVGQIVTFQAYKGNEPLKREVIKISNICFNSTKDGRIFYHLGQRVNKDFASVTSITTGESIQESKLFNISE